MEYRIARTIKDIDPVAWDRLAGDNLSMTYAWQRMIEDGWIDHQAAYLLFEDIHGPVASVIASFNASFDRTGWREEAMKRATLLISAPYSSSHCGIAVRPGIDLTMILPEIQAALGRLCWQNQRVIYAVSNVDPAIMPIYRDHGFIVAPQPSFSILDLQQIDSYEAYLARLAGKDRAEIRRIRRRATEAGVTLEHCPMEANTDDLYPLICQVYARHGFTPATMPFRSTLFGIMQREMPNKVHLFKGWVDGNLEGVLITFLGQDTVWWPFAGLNYVVSRPTYLYFGLIDAMIRWAIEQNIQTIYGGLSNEREKRGHGFHSYDRWFCYRAHPHPLHWLFHAGLPVIQRVIGGTTTPPPRDPITTNSGNGSKPRELESAQ